MSDFPEPKSFVGDEDDRAGGFINRRTGKRAEPEEVQYYHSCDECRGNVIYPISLQGVGVFCSHECATKASERHAAAMDPRRI